MDDIDDIIRAAIWEANASIEVAFSNDEEKLEIVAVMAKRSSKNAKDEWEPTQVIHWDSRSI